MEQYIPKAAVVEEIEKRIKTLNEMLVKRPVSSPTLEKLIEENKKVLSLLDTFGVKEVDFEKDIDLQINKLHTPLNYEELKNFAKHFFELGLKAEKGEE